MKNPNQAKGKTANQRRLLKAQTKRAAKAKSGRAIASLKGLPQVDPFIDLPENVPGLSIKLTTIKDTMVPEVFCGDSAQVLKGHSLKLREGLLVVGSLKGGDQVFGRLQFTPDGLCEVRYVNPSYVAPRYRPDEFAWLFPVHYLAMEPRARTKAFDASGGGLTKKSISSKTKTASKKNLLVDVMPQELLKSVRGPLGNNSYVSFALHGIGDSMEPEIHEGDRAVVKNFDGFGIEARGELVIGQLNTGQWVFGICHRPGESLSGPLQISYIDGTSICCEGDDFDWVYPVYEIEMMCRTNPTKIMAVKTLKFPLIKS